MGLTRGGAAPLARSDSAAGSEATSAAASSKARRRTPKDGPLTCQVPGCSQDVRAQGHSRYHIRYRICKAHSLEPSLLISGSLQRFCQQCGALHPLEDFEPGRRSCKLGLARHNAARRALRKAEALANQRAKELSQAQAQSEAAADPAAAAAAEQQEAPAPCSSASRCRKRGRSASCSAAQEQPCAKRGHPAADLPPPSQAAAAAWEASPPLRHCPSYSSSHAGLSLLLTPQLLPPTPQQADGEVHARMFSDSPVLQLQPAPVLQQVVVVPPPLPQHASLSSPWDPTTWVVPFDAAWPVPQAQAAPAAPVPEPAQQADEAQRALMAHTAAALEASRRRLPSFQLPPPLECPESPPPTQGAGQGMPASPFAPTPLEPPPPLPPAALTSHGAPARVAAWAQQHLIGSGAYAGGGSYAATPEPLPPMQLGYPVPAYNLERSQTLPSTAVLVPPQCCTPTGELDPFIQWLAELL